MRGLGGLTQNKLGAGMQEVLYLKGVFTRPKAM